MTQKPVVMPHYPHMLAEDTAIWTEFLGEPPFPISGVIYDLHVGRAVKPIDGDDELGARIASGVSRKRIDAVLFSFQGVFVVEIKPVASLTALGQVLGYTRLFLDEYDIRGGAVPMVVCSAVDDDLIEEYSDLGVAIVQV